MDYFFSYTSKINILTMSTKCCPLFYAILIVVYWGDSILLFHSLEFFARFKLYSSHVFVREMATTMQFLNLTTLF